MRGTLLKVGGCLLAVGMVASCLLFLPPMLGISAAGQMDIREATSLAARTARGMLLLARPVFAQEGGLEGITFIQEEAGISAWTKIDGGIDLRRAAAAFRIVERQTDEYVIGSVGLPGLPGTEDARVFVHRDGWVLAYYFKAAPVAKIIDLRSPAVTKLEQALGLVTTAAGVPLVEVKHYDFRFPDAEKIMVIVGDDTFRLKIPGAFTVFERSYSVTAAGRHMTATVFRIDETHIASRGYGMLTVAHLRSDAFATITSSRRVAIVLIYRE